MTFWQGTISFQIYLLFLIKKYNKPNIWLLKNFLSYLILKIGKYFIKIIGVIIFTPQTHIVAYKHGCSRPHSQSLHFDTQPFPIIFASLFFFCSDDTKTFILATDYLFFYPDFFIVFVLLFSLYNQFAYCLTVACLFIFRISMFFFICLSGLLLSV